MTVSSLLLIPEWGAPASVHACSTLRGDTASPFDLTQAHCREQLHITANLPQKPVWLKQVHGDTVIRATQNTQTTPEADASFTDERGVVCAILTADCLPILLCQQDGTKVAAIHGGWRSLASGIIDKTIHAAGFVPEQTLAWLGPAIGPNCFEVGNEVRDQFLKHWPHCIDAFLPTRSHHIMANIYAIAAHQLQLHGVHAILGGQWCTYSEPKNFFSWRRQKETGRMASLIWMT